ncbi:MAG: aminotransferase class I/II-fold pyridoxal phosphate-dependent enzyme [Acholeplasmataceae bacterium]|nr:aminotransferase class I/II-fold pyridoxal phosphate-dependent enzyme [Acholeplasmataceae bacterium]
MSVDILKISKDAVEASKKYNDVINASIGMFYDEDKSIGGMPIVTKAIRQFSDEQILPYPAVDGGADFKKNVISWILGKHEKDIREKMYVNACATPGGSGAIASTFALFAKPNDFIFVSDIRWQYERFADRAKLRIFEHKLFKNDQFDLDSFKTRLDELCKIQRQVIVIINDPCHNPTGYTLNLSEWQEIIDTLNSKKENDIVFLYDVAYLDFSHEEDTRHKMTYLPQLEKHVLTIISFSGSKTFGVYGMRLGAAVAISTNEELVKNAIPKYINEARGSWSATPTPSIELLNHFSKEENKEAFKRGLTHITTLVQKRSALFLKQAKEAGLTIYPFKSGFYTVILTKDPEKDYLKLAEHHIFAVPMTGGIRLALCSLSLTEIDGLSLKIKQILKI